MPVGIPQFGQADLSKRDRVKRTLAARRNQSTNQLANWPNDRREIYKNEYGNIYVFPNPSDEHINIQISNLEYQKVQYQLLDGQGRIVSKEELIPYNGSIQKKINVQSVAPGSYILKITSKDVNYSQIVVVQ